MTAAQILRDAWERISDKSRWSKGAYARHENGNIIGYFEPSACKWCALGSLFLSLERAGVKDPSMSKTKAERLLRKAAAMFTRKDAIGCGIAYVNDDRGHVYVKRMYKVAIEFAEAKR